MRTAENILKKIHQHFNINSLTVIVDTVITHPFGPIYVVSEGEESIRADSHSLHGADPVLLLGLRQKLRDLIVHGLPDLKIWTLSHKTHTATLRESLFSEKYTLIFFDLFLDLNIHYHQGCRILTFGRYRYADIIQTLTLRYTHQPILL